MVTSASTVDFFKSMQVQLSSGCGAVKYISTKMRGWLPLSASMQYFFMQNAVEYAFIKK